MGPLELIQLNLLSPMVLAFVLGVVATLIHSDLKFPDAFTSALSIYLLFAIGLKGGAELAATSFTQFFWPGVVTLLLGIMIPIWSFAALRWLGRFDVANAAAIAAHYGSVSAVTFSASQTFVEQVGSNYEGFMPTLLAMLEVPGIVVALLLARSSGQGGGQSWRVALHEVMSGKSIVLLLGGLVIGFLSGKPGLDLVAPVFVTPFKGVLALFLLELGLLTGRHLADLRQAGRFLIGFGIVMPLIHGVLGAWLGSVAGLSMGGSMILATMAASASYIAAPAAVRIALPQANPGYYLTASLAITFPFNLVIGLPIYHALANWFTR
jgi:hypothetical protein